MVLVARDLMNGNLRLADMGFKEEAGGYDAIAAGFQGKRQWTDGKLNGDVMETLLNTSFDSDGLRQPQVFATEGDALNGIAMLLGSLLTQRPQFFSDVRTYWSPEAVRRVTGHELTGRAAGGFVDFRNSGASTLNATECEAEADGTPVIKHWWDLTEDDIQADLAATTFHSATQEYFPGGGFSTHFTTVGDTTVTAVTYWSPEAVRRVTGHELTGRAAGGFVDFRNSGASTLNATECEAEADGTPVIKHWWDLTEDDIQADLAATTFHSATQEYFPGGGFSTHFTTVGDTTVTAVRMNMVAGVGPTLQIVEGRTLPDEGTDTIVERADPTWPTTFFVSRIPSSGAFSSVYDWMDKWGANHTSTGYSHIGADVLTLAAMLRIPVSMHNIETKDIFRPRTWSSSEPSSNRRARDTDRRVRPS